MVPRLNHPRPRHAPLIASVAVLSVAAGCLVLADASAQASPTRPATPKDMTSSTTLAPGVVLQHVSTTIGYRSQQVNLVQVDLTKPGVGIDAASPGGVVGSARATVRVQTNARRAIAGINADFFDLNNDNASPRGALVTSGHLLKSTSTPRNANLVIRKTKNGHEVASVGAVNFDATVKRLRKGAHTVTRSLAAVNSLASARAGGISLLNAEMAPSYLSRSCALASGRVRNGVWTVTSVRSHAYAIPSFYPTTWGFLSCSGAGQHWIDSTLRPGDRLVVGGGFAGGTPWAAVSGGSVLVRKGSAYNDPYGEHLPYPGRNAETFVCVARSGTQLTLGTIDGYTQQSAGVTYQQLTQYMLSLGGCWSGVVLDGGGSTTMVAKLPGSTKATVQNVPADDPPRQVADTLVVFGKS